MMNITTVGVDLAKEVITVRTMDAHGHVLKIRDLRVTEFSAWLLQLSAGTVLGMEACSSASHWARKMQGRLTYSMADKCAHGVAVPVHS
ncbi:MAG: hypothetical protein Q8Q76_07125 [Methylotenera sp.]|nr:hypothetical protein [Methylotenera sp.]